MTTPTKRQEHQVILGICLLAALADGAPEDAEREELNRIALLLGGENLDGSSIFQDVLFNRVSLAELCDALPDKATAKEIYEMAAGVCAADQKLAPEEEKFLADLRAQLGLGTDVIAAGATAAAILNPSPETLALSNAVAEQTETADNDRMILNYAILNGALELLPQSLATMAVIPMQLKMVYRIGRSHGLELDAARIKELAATAGLGVGSQVLEGYARRFLKGVLGKKSTTGGVAAQATSSVFAFASTYALGQVAQAYYGGGRQMTKEQMKSLFDSVSSRARELYNTYLPQIRDKSQNLDLPGILREITNKSPADQGAAKP
jgi:uncharacterized protein (DUF697 family)/tellurite resistance protein